MWQEFSSETILILSTHTTSITKCHDEIKTERLRQQRVLISCLIVSQHRIDLYNMQQQFVSPLLTTSSRDIQTGNM